MWKWGIRASIASSPSPEKLQKKAVTCTIASSGRSHIPHRHTTSTFPTTKAMRALARRRVQELTLRFVPSSALSRPSRLLRPALFSCAALVRLHLQRCYMPPAPQGFPGFPNLVSLILLHVRLMFMAGGTQIESLIAAAPRLEELQLRNVFSITTVSDDEHHEVDTWAIQAPDLRKLVLDIEGPNDNGCRIKGPLPKLEEACISIDYLLGTHDFLDTFHRIATVNKLRFISFDEVLTQYMHLRDCINGYHLV